MHLIKSIRDEDLIVNNNFIYKQVRTNIETINWRCINADCFATAITDLNYQLNLRSFRVISLHNHVSNNELAIKKKKISEIKILINQGFDCPRDLVNKVLRGADDITINAMGNLESLVRTIRNIRSKAKNPAPFLFQELKLSQNLSYTHTGQLFYRFGPGNFHHFNHNEDFLIFYSDFMKNNLKENPIWAVDGTFDVVPRPFYQLYTVSYLKGHHIFPVVFVLLKNKSRITYSSMFDVLKNIAELSDPISIKTDFEQASIQALRENFPTAHLSGCQFHLGQSLYRKVQTFGLQNLYKIDNNVKKFAKALMGLSYVAFDRIRETFFDLRSHNEFPSVLDAIYDYFYDNYIGDTLDARFPVNLWHYGNNLNVDLPRTNNAIEGWHSIFKKTFGTSRYSFHLLVEKMINEEDAIRIKAVREENGNPLSRNIKYLRIENQIQNFFDENVGSNYGVDFVFDLIRFLAYD